MAASVVAKRCCLRWSINMPYEVPLCSDCCPPCSAAVFTVTGIKQSLAEAKMRWVKVGYLTNSG